MPLKELTVTTWVGDRDVWREHLLTQVFAGHLSLLVEQFYQLTKVPKNILWENIAVRVFSIYERRILLEVVEEKRARAQADYDFLVSEQTTALFGLSKNPLSVFHRQKQKIALSEDLVRVRRTCCYYYQATEPAEYCGNCPLLLKKKKPIKIPSLAC